LGFPVGAALPSRVDRVGRRMSTDGSTGAAELDFPEEARDGGGRSLPKPPTRAPPPLPGDLYVASVPGNVMALTAAPYGTLAGLMCAFPFLSGCRVHSTFAHWYNGLSFLAGARCASVAKSMVP
jgi:hypothetical protein